MEAVHQQKIEETVVEILKHANMEEMTEFKVRVTASERLGIDLSDTNHKSFIRGLVESFLLSTVESTRDGKEPDSNFQEETIEQQAKIKKEVNDNEDLVICQLSNTRSVAVQEFKGRAFVSIRKYYHKDGKQIPTAKGITLNREQWAAFRKNVPAIEEAVVKMQSKIRSEPCGEQIEDVADTMTSPHELFLMEPDRFNGKNYLHWAQQMEIFLKQLKIAYVLTDPCPGVTLCPQASAEEVAKVKASERKWVNDDRICRRHILNSLSDHLYYQYSKKTKTAKELWKELKLVYLDEEFGTRRYQVKKYIEFQMVDENSIIEQVLELNHIADSIVAAGIMIGENFHVSVILSKLPPSWKDFCVKLMRMEYLTFVMLMDHIKVEEESRNRDKQGNSSKSLDFPMAANSGPTMRETKKAGMSWKRQESDMDGKNVFCYNCRKKGHISKNCPNKKLDKGINEAE